MIGPPIAKITAPPSVYRDRRSRLATALTRPIVLFSGHAPARNYADNMYPFRAGSAFLYFGGPPIENAALMIDPGSDGESGCTLFRQPAGPDDALWIGHSISDENLRAAAGLKATAVRDADQLSTALAGRAGAWVAPPYPNTIEWIARVGLEPATEDETRAIVDLRLCKDEHELRAMRLAAEVGCEAHRAAMAATRPGVGEADVVAAYMSVIHRHQCGVSFTPIVTIRGEVLHGQGYRNALKAGDLLLCDAGAEEPSGYASDITRTWPVSGKWSDIQRHLYTGVERALIAAVAACKPGARYRDVHDLSARVICETLVAAELLRGDPADLTARRAHTLFFPHGVGHLIGLDVHDMEDYGDIAGYQPGRTRRPEFGNKFLRLDRDLAPGMTVTIEPGIYMVPAIWESDELVQPFADVVNRAKVDALLADAFGGIRIEQTICVCESGEPEVLSASLPTDAGEIEACVGNAA